MTQLYLCEEPYWSKYDQSDLYDHPIEINVISDGEYIIDLYWGQPIKLAEVASTHFRIA